MGSTSSKSTYETSPKTEFADSIENHSEYEKDVESEKLQSTVPEEKYELSTKIWCWGIFLASLSGVIFTINNVIFKLNSLDYVDTLFVRSLFQVLVLGIWNCYHKYPYWFGKTKSQVLLLIQGLCSGIMLMCSYKSIEFMPLGDALTILFSSPLFTMILERIVFKTGLGIWRCVFAF